MAKTSYLSIPDGLETAYKKGLQSGDHFQFARIRIKNLFLSRARVKGITLKSQLVALAPVWAALTTTEKDAWIAASAESNLSGWKGFVYDTTARRRASLAGYATPSVLYQAMVGRILVEDPATGLQIEQAHPISYFVQRKVTGTRSQYSPVRVSESFSLPLDIAISWRSELSAIDETARARFYCIIYSSYQGLTLETVVQIPFGFSDDWTRGSASISEVVGPVQGFSAFIEVFNATGNLYFDDVVIQHSGQNWARDANCNNIQQSFTRAFFQVAAHWTPTNISEGADFGSVYFNDTSDPAQNLVVLETGYGLLTEADEQLALENYVPTPPDPAENLLVLEDGYAVYTEADEQLALESYIP